MRVFYDNEAYCRQQVGGVSRLFAELYKEFRSNDYGVRPSTTVSFGRNALAVAAGLPHLSPLRTLRFRGRVQVETFLSRALAMERLVSGHFDLFHPTYYGEYLLGRAGRQPFVLTVFDMIHERLRKEYFMGDRRVRVLKRELARRAARIIAISESTRKDLMELLGIAESRIDVVHIGFRPDAFARIPCTKDEERQPPFILFVGLRGGYKNFAICVQALKRLSKEVPDFRLLCVGGGAFSAPERALLEAEGLANRTEQQSLDDEGLRDIYRKAVAFIFPSFYEGFGIPVLEAFGGGCPAILSDIPVFHEVAANAAFYFDPRSEESLASAIRSALFNTAQRQAVVSAGYARLSLFTWERCAEQTARTYARALGG